MSPLAIIPHTTSLGAFVPHVHAHSLLRDATAAERNALHSWIDQFSPKSVVTVSGLEPACGRSAAVA